MHAGSHGFDQFLNFAAADFLDAQGAGALAQNGVSGLSDFKFHGRHNLHSRTGAVGARMDLNSTLFEDIREGSRHEMKIVKSNKKGTLFASMRLEHEFVAA